MKPEIEWICTLSGVDEVMPIIRASQYKHEWMKKAVHDMKTNGSLSNKHKREWEQNDVIQDGFQSFKPDDNRHTAKCPSTSNVA